MSREIIRPEQFCQVKTKTLSEDVGLELNEEQLQELASLYEGIFDTINPGKITVGKIVSADSDGVLIDIGFKSRGLIPKFEFGPHELKSFKPGQEIEVIIETLEDPDGNVVLSYEKAKAMRAWDAIVKLFEEGKPVEGVVTHKVKGGLSVDIGIPAFLPGSQIDLQRVTDFDQYVGQTIIANLIKLNQKRGNVIISRRKYLNEQRSGARKELLVKLSEGQVIQGIVKNITNYGAFIDIGGVDGLLHITDMTWGRIAHPSEMLKMGETITVKVLSFDKDNEKISLGIKQLQDNPWEELNAKVEAGAKIKGKISSITDYGLFVEVAPGIEGLVHISEISWTDRITNLQDRYKVGQEIEVLVASIDKEKRRMSLSIKQLAQNPWESVEKEFNIGQKITGKISNITDFGIFVQLKPGIDGLVHISDLSWTEHIDHPSDRYKQREEVEAVVLAVDKNSKKISLGIKQLSQDPWDTVESDYPMGTVLDGTVSKITNFGAFIKLESGIEGLVHNATLATEQSGKKADEAFKVGDKAQFRVVNVNKQERKLGLSTRLEGEIKTAAPKTAPRKERKEPRQKQATSANTASNDSGRIAKSSLQIALENALKKDDDTESK